MADWHTPVVAGFLLFFGLGLADDFSMAMQINPLSRASESQLACR